MKSQLFFLFLILTQTLTAQTLTEAFPAPEFDGVTAGSIAFADVDGDNDQDVLITGVNNSSQPIAKLYTNDGTGIFTEMMGTPFDGVTSSSIAFADVDGDNDQDVLITGTNNSAQKIAKLYTNDGTGTFSEMMGTPFAGVFNGSIAFADVDGDNDQDVLITGINILPPGSIAKLYINDGTGTFNEMTGTPFGAASAGSIAFADVDGDNDQDVLITGVNISAQQITKLYTNDGTGTFIEMTGTPFDATSAGSIAFADVDGDNDQDVLITGFNTSFQPIAKLYTNDGMGTFSEETDTPFEGVVIGSIAFADVDCDNDLDVLITGKNNSDVPIAKLYTNDGTGIFTEMMGTSFDGVNRSSIAFADVDGDNDQDVLITGDNSSELRISKLYINDKMTSSSDDLVDAISLDFVPFPNPCASSILSLSYDSPEMSEITLKVYNVNGILLSQQKEFSVIGQQTFSIDIVALPKGNYLLELDNGNSKGSAKFIVQ